MLLNPNFLQPATVEVAVLNCVVADPGPFIQTAILPFEMIAVLVRVSPEETIALVSQLGSWRAVRLVPITFLARVHQVVVVVDEIRARLLRFVMVDRKSHAEGFT